MTLSQHSVQFVHPLNDTVRGLGWSPEGNVYFSYGVAVAPDQTGYTADAAADLDEDGFVQYWAYIHPNGSGGRVPAQLGCNVAFPPAKEVAGCSADAGKTLF